MSQSDIAKPDLVSEAQNSESIEKSANLFSFIEDISKNSESLKKKKTYYLNRYSKLLDQIINKFNSSKSSQESIDKVKGFQEKYKSLLNSDLS